MEYTCLWDWQQEVKRVKKAVEAATKKPDQPAQIAVCYLLRPHRNTAAPQTAGTACGSCWRDWYAS
eukprot:1568158-Amphidinium_carterae.1